MYLRRNQWDLDSLSTCSDDECVVDDGLLGQDHLRELA